MKRTVVVNCLEKVGEEVRIFGWVQTVRAHGKIAFFDLHDRSGIIQVVASSGDLVGKISALKPQDVVEVFGKVKKREEKYINKDIATGTIEVEADNVETISKADEMPFDMGGKDLNLELPTLLDHRALVLRHPKISSIFKIQEAVVASFRETLKEEGFTEVFVPTIVPTATEGGAEVFGVDYYGHKVYLAQSPQLYKQMMVSVFERVFSIAHAYRAEPSVTTRHLSEYVSLDVEFGFIESWQDLMDMVEKIIAAMIRTVRTQHSKILQSFDMNLPEIKKPFPRITMREGQEIVFKQTGRDHRREMDLDPSDEKELCEWAEKETGAPFVFVTHFPTKKRPFYTMPDSTDPKSTLSFDLLGFNEEWVTGGQRINNYEMLVNNIKKWGNKPESFELYLQAFKYGMPPEGGFAMGLERITKDILSLSNVREASLFPRDMERVDVKFSTLEKGKKS